MKILVVEDNVTLGEGICKGLSKKMYAVDLAENGHMALEMISLADYDLIILDLSLPFLSGWEVLEDIRQKNSQIKIIILSANNFVEDKAKGLDMGANDYLTKPFDFLELEARIRNLLRQSFFISTSVLRYENIALNTIEKTVEIDKINIKLTKKEYGILEYLLINKEMVISAENLIEHVWNEERNPFSNAFKYQIYSLRKKISNINPEAANMIQTIRGSGYKLSNKY